MIVPCYNAAPFVRATIASVLRQSWSDLEVLAVDDGSTDATFQIIEAIAAEDPRVRVIRLPRNHGSPAAPRNAGVAAACGTWVAFLDADDLWHPLKLELQLRALHEYRALMCSALMKDFVDERKIVVSPPYEPKVQRIDVTGRVPHIFAANAHNRGYLLTKAVRSGHMLAVDELQPAKTGTNGARLNVV